MDLVAFPLYQQNIILFSSELALNTSYSNIKVHLAAIKFFSQMHSYNSSFPLFSRLYLLLRGIRRTQGNKFKKPKRTPITPQLLTIIKFNLFNSSTIYEDKLMVWAAMLTAFFGFLRVSEYTSTLAKSYEPTTTLCYKDIIFKNNRVNIDIKASKTDPFRVGSVIRLSPNNSSLCPVDTLRQYLLVHPTKSGPLFTFQNGKYLTRKNISNLLQEFLPQDSSKNISSHSFRIGAATTAANAGYPRWLIQSLGRWTSDCFRDYIRIPDSTIDLVSVSMVNQPSHGNTYDPDLF